MRTQTAVHTLTLSLSLTPLQSDRSILPATCAQASISKQHLKTQNLKTRNLKTQFPNQSTGEGQF